MALLQQKSKISKPGTELLTLPQSQHARLGDLAGTAARATVFRSALRQVLGHLSRSRHAGNLHILSGHGYSRSLPSVSEIPQPA